MELLNLFKRGTNGKAGMNELYLDHLRTITFLENARVLMNLFEDGKEKASGEYILDAHYVTSLVEDTIRVLGALVFDACVIRNQGGDALLRRYDREQARAAQFLTSALAGGAFTERPDGEEPEYRLLKEVLDWCVPADQENPNSVMGFIKDIFNHVMTRTCTVVFPYDQTSDLDIIGSGIVHRIHFLPMGLDRPEAAPLSLESMDFRSLRVLLRDVSCDLVRSEPGSVQVRWAAMMEGPFLSLGFREGNRILCQADICLSGDRKSDYVFIFMHDRMMPSPLIPGAFQTARVEQGLLAWLYNGPAQVIDDALAHVGRLLFSDARGLEQIISDTRR